MTVQNDGSANVVPTENFAIFYQADEWKQSARKFLTGADGPLLYLEWKLWQRYRQAAARLQKQHSKGKRR